MFFFSVLPELVILPLQKNGPPPSPALPPLKKTCAPPLYQKPRQFWQAQQQRIQLGGVAPGGVTTGETASAGLSGVAPPQSWDARPFWRTEKGGVSWGWSCGKRQLIVVVFCCFFWFRFWSSQLAPWCFFSWNLCVFLFFSDLWMFLFFLLDVLELLNGFGKMVNYHDSSNFSNWDFY